MICFGPSILDDLGVVVEEYIDAHQLCSKQQERLRLHVRRFNDWRATPRARGDSDSLRVSAWLADLAADKYAPSTVNGYRQSILGLIRFATPDGDPLPRTDRIRRQPTPEKINFAYTQDELRTLIARAPEYQPVTHRTYGRGLRGDTIPRHRPDGVRWAIWWEAFTRVGYDTAQYLSDMRLWKWSDLASDGTLSFIRHKTGKTLTVRLSKAAIAAAQKIGHEELILPWDYEMGSYFPREWRKFAAFAEVRNLEPKAVRRSGLTYTYIEQGAEAARILAGHASFTITAKHYIDWSIAKRPIVQAPAL